MSLADLSFIAAFVVFPLVIVGLSVWALRTLNRRERRPLARFGSDRRSESPAETTQEMPAATVAKPHDWAASVQPTRGPIAAEESERAAAPTQAFKVPTYRGRAGGVVRRVTFRRNRTQRQHATTLPQENDEQPT